MLFSVTWDTVLNVHVGLVGGESSQCSIYNNLLPEIIDQKYNNVLGLAMTTALRKRPSSVVPDFPRHQLQI